MTRQSIVVTPGLLLTGDWRMYVAVAAVGGFLVGLVFATCVACAATGSKAVAKALK